MVNIHTASSLFSMPTPGALFGSRASSDLIARLNDRMGSSGKFGTSDDPFKSHYQLWMKQVVEPYQMSNIRIDKVINQVINKDHIRPIICEADLMDIPPCMVIPFASYGPLRKLIQQGRVDGFGLYPEGLPDKEHDPYQRQAYSGHAELSAENIDAEGYYHIRTTHTNDDPDLTFEEKAALRDTYAFIDEFLETSQLDPTDYPAMRG